MAGYIIYSLDWNKFQHFVNNPTRNQLLAFAKRLAQGLGGDDEDPEERASIHDWPREPEERCHLVRERLARPDWYGDLSGVGKSVWSVAMFGFCCNSRTSSKTVGFRVEHNGIYWDVLDLARKQLNVGPEQILPDVALTAFGKRPYRYHPPTDAANAKSADTGAEEEDLADWFDDWPDHSMHTPDEVHNMLQELRSIGPAIENARNKQALRDYDSLVSVLEKLDKEGRMLFVQVDT